VHRLAGDTLMNAGKTVPRREPGRFARWLLGSGRRQRADMQFTLIAMGVYAFSLAAQWQTVMAGAVEAGIAAELTITIVALQLTLVALIRSGVTRTLEDSGLVLLQMAIGILLIAWAYVINAHLNGVLLMLVALVLSYSALTLSPRLCLVIGVFAVLVFAVVIVVAIQLAPAQFPPQKEYVHLAFLTVVLPTLSYIASRVSRLRLQLKQQRRVLKASVEAIKKIAVSDELTGLKNRRYVDDWLRLQVAQSRRLDVPVCIALLDIDHFKRVNDVCGHTVGDLVLKEFAAIASSVVRDGEVFARWGGEEFLWVMTGVSPQRAVLAVDRLRALVSSSPHWKTQPGWTVSFSAGVAELNPRLEIEVALRDADDALYRAKANGRARTELH
jgi:diguanylate cyclase